MNICMLAYAHYINDARIKSYVRTLENYGHQVDVIALRMDGELACEVRSQGTIFRVMDKYQGGSTLRYVWSYLVFFLKSFFLLSRRSFSRPYHVVHVHNMPNALVFAALVPKMFGARVMLDVHDLMTVNYMAKFDAGENALPVRILRAEQRISAMLADHMFCADHNQKDYLVETCKIAADKVTVLMNLPNVDLFQPVTPEKKNDGGFHIVYHGTIAHRLGIDLIVRAMAKVVEKAPAQLWIYGAGDFLPEATELASQLNLDGKVHFSRSFFPVEQIPKMVSGMDLGIIGNRRNLACDKYMVPVKLLEYVYLGIPVVAPSLGAITRYFDDSMIRFYEPENVDQMADAILEMYNNQAERERFARTAVKFYETHSMQAQAQRYLERVTVSRVDLGAESERHA